MNKKLIAVLSSAALITVPLASLAFNAGSIPSTTASITVEDLIDILFAFIWPIIVAFIIVMFIAAGFLFITAQGDPGKIAQGRQALIWGIVGVVVVLVAFSITFIIRNQLGL